MEFFVRGSYVRGSGHFDGAQRKSSGFRIKASFGTIALELDKGEDEDERGFCLLDDGAMSVWRRMDEVHKLGDVFCFNL